MALVCTAASECDIENRQRRPRDRIQAAVALGYMVGDCKCCMIKKQLARVFGIGEGGHQRCAEGGDDGIVSGLVGSHVQLAKPLARFSRGHIHGAFRQVVHHAIRGLAD